MRRVEHVVLKGEYRAACKVLVGKLEGKRPFGRSALRSDYSITTRLKKYGQRAQI
jgi:hypothetical protein